MPIGISDEHIELATSLRGWAQGLAPTDAAREAEHDHAALSGWAGRVAEMGLTSIAIAEPEGGGGSLLDQAVALEAAAYALVPGPMLGTVLTGLLLDEVPLRSAIAEGSASVGVGSVTSLDLADGVLSGTVAVVHDAPITSHLLLGSGDQWFVVPADRATITPGSTPDLGRSVGSVRLSGVPVGETTPLDTDSATVRRLLVVLAAAEASGVARWALDTAVAYAGVREQFGQKIGAFQSIKHLCAELLEHSESITAAAWDAATAFEHTRDSHAEDTRDQRDFAAAVAGVACFDAAVEVAKGCIQVLGGIGFTFEHDAHLYLRRATALRGMVGGSEEHAADLFALAARGVRRRSQVDLGERGDAERGPVRAEAERIAGLPQQDQRIALVESGFLTPHWPAPYGLGADPVQQLVIDEELAAAGVQRPDLLIGAWAAPTILNHGNDAQQERFVAPTLRGEIDWCQLFSEPGAGSDLASLRTRATRVDGGWRLTGQKVWTSLAREADWAICLARTSTEGKPHAGITYFLVDMRSPGLDVRPLREITGDALFNEVFLDDVFVPDDCVVGDVDGGWRLARTTLANERVAMAGTRLGDSVEQAVELATTPVARARTGAAVALATVVKLLGTRALLRTLSGQGPGPESSVSKLVGVRSRQDASELVVQLIGDRIFTDSDLARAAVREQLHTRCLSIAGGTTQVLRNVAGERILGLPRG